MKSIISLYKVRIEVSFGTIIKEYITHEVAARTVTEAKEMACRVLLAEKALEKRFNNKKALNNSKMELQAVSATWQCFL